MNKQYPIRLTLTKADGRVVFTGDFTEPEVADLVWHTLRPTLVEGETLDSTIIDNDEVAD